jgi:8-oxo-dGTP diphosphatase
LGSIIEPVIHASGGVVLRPSDNGSGGAYEVLVVHRPRYDDWSLPKGKDEPGESPEQAAVREVWEEAGQPARIIAPLGSSSYRTQAGAKQVLWFAMRATGVSEFSPNPEVDSVAWLSPGAAAELLTYDRDRDLVSSIDPEALLGTGTLYLVRHAAAGDRTTWMGKDRDRPLTAKGEAQARGILGRLRDEGLERIITSPYLRCTETVRPLAESIGLELETNDYLAEAAGGKPARALVESLSGQNTVLCSHGDVIPQLLDWMVDEGLRLESSFDCKKGSIWVVEIESGEFASARYLPPVEA